jgi:hypothetical protein
MWWLLGAVLWMIKAWLFVLLLVLSVVWWNQGMLLYMPFINDRNGTKRLTKYNEEGFTRCVCVCMSSFSLFRLRYRMGTCTCECE